MLVQGTPYDYNRYSEWLQHNATGENTNRGGTHTPAANIHCNARSRCLKLSLVHDIAESEYGHFVSEDGCASSLAKAWCQRLTQLAKASKQRCSGRVLKAREPCFGRRHCGRHHAALWGERRGQVCPGGRRDPEDKGDTWWHHAGRWVWTRLGTCA